VGLAGEEAKEKNTMDKTLIYRYNCATRVQWNAADAQFSAITAQLLRYLLR
jgi:hypothetical protein